MWLFNQNNRKLKQKFLRFSHGRYPLKKKLLSGLENPQLYLQTSDSDEQKLFWVKDNGKKIDIGNGKPVNKTGGNRCCIQKTCYKTEGNSSCIQKVCYNF